jgi:heparin binding hemagglutinin HbhA
MTLTTITRSKPFYVAAGVTDAAVAKLRGVPAKFSTVKVERRDVEKAVATLQVEVVSLPARAQATAVGIAGEVTGRVDDVYGDMLVRGRKVVGRIRRPQAAPDLKRDAATTVRRTKAATTTAKKGAADTTKAAKATRTTARKAAASGTRSAQTANRASAKRTATTARKRTASTRTATKSATTSARKTAASARKATTAAAAKTGR